MGTTTRLTFEGFERLPEHEAIPYELDEGELLMEPSPSFLHNRIRDRIARHLAKYVAEHRLGEITVEMDFRLGPEIVRNPDVAFVTNEHLRSIDVNRSPVEGAPELAVEVISPNRLAQDTLKKVSQFLAAGGESCVGCLSWLAISRGLQTKRKPTGESPGLPDRPSSLWIGIFAFAHLCFQ